MRISRIHESVISVYNPVPYNICSPSVENWGSAKRTPIVFSRCGRGGSSFVGGETVPGSKELADHLSRTFLLEDDLTNSYCYPALQETSDGFLAAYYHSADTGICLRDLKIAKVLKSEYL